MAFSLKAVFGIDATGVRTELRQLRRELNSFVQDYAKLGAGVAVGAFVALSKGALDLAAGLKDASLQIGINVESLQALHYAATQNGSSVESMNKALEKLRLNSQAAAEGNQQQAEAFAKLGLNVADFLRLPLEKRYEAVAKAVKNSTDKQAAYNAVSEIFGTKIGPDQIAVLNALATDGFPKTAKAAAEAGQVMSAETVAALEKASQAIDDFKKRATVAVGSILVNFRTEEGLKLMGLQLLRAAAGFGGRIIDAIAQANDVMGAVFKGTFTGITNYLRDRLLDGVAAMARALNLVLPERFEFNVANLDQFRSSGEYVGASISRAISETKPTAFAQDFTAFWDDAVKKQQGVVDNLNKVDFAKPAAELRKAGAELKANAADSLDRSAQRIKEAGLTVGEALADGGVAWAHAQKLWSESIDKMIHATKQMGVLVTAIRGGSVFNDLESGTLEEIVRQNRAKADELLNPALTNTNIGTQLEAARLKAEAMNAQRELDIRNQFQSAISGPGGVAAARRQFDPIVFEELLRRFGPSADTSEQTKLLRQIADQRRDFQAIAEGLKGVGQQRN